jgi:hypothetical protein
MGWLDFMCEMKDFSISISSPQIPLRKVSLDGSQASESLITGVWRLPFGVCQLKADERLSTSGKSKQVSVPIIRQTTCPH